MSTKAKIIAASLSLVVFAILIFIIKTQYDTINRFKSIEDTISKKDLPDNVSRSETNYVTSKQLDKFAEDSKVDIKDIKDDLKSLNAELKGVNRVIVVTPGETKVNVSSTDSVKGDGEAPKCEDGVCLDPYGHLSRTQVLRLDEPLGGKSVPFGTVSFSSWRDKPWDYSIFPRKYSIVNTLGIDEDGRSIIHSKVMVESNGKSESLSISDSKFLEIYPEPKFRFAPRLYLGFDGGWSIGEHFDVSPNLMLSLFNYSKVKKNPELMFLGLGIGLGLYDKELLFHVNPVSYNLGDHLPLVDNLFIGPSIGMDLDKNALFSVGIRAGL